MAQENNFQHFTTVYLVLGKCQRQQILRSRLQERQENRGERARKLSWFFTCFLSFLSPRVQTGNVIDSQFKNLCAFFTLALLMARKSEWLHRLNCLRILLLYAEDSCNPDNYLPTIDSNSHACVLFSGSLFIIQINLNFLFQFN